MTYMEIRKELNIRKLTNEQAAELMIAIFSDKANHMGNENDFADWLSEMFMLEHRTLQATMIRIIRKFLLEYGKVTNHDLRNEAAIKWAKAATDLTKDGYYIPFV